jgi:hypothetical protein
MPVRTYQQLSERVSAQIGDLSDFGAYSAFAADARLSCAVFLLSSLGPTGTNEHSKRVLTRNDTSAWSRSWGESSSNFAWGFARIGSCVRRVICQGSKAWRTGEIHLVFEAVDRTIPRGFAIDDH